MQEYVAGFMFDESQTCVALVLKERPAWQEGLLNGIGGKIESGETPLEAMIREFREETTVEHPVWEQTVILEGKGFRVYFFRAFTDQVYLAETVDEKIHRVRLDTLTKLATIKNLQWLIPMQLDPHLVFPITIQEK